MALKRDNDGPTSDINGDALHEVLCRNACGWEIFTGVRKAARSYLAEYDGGIVHRE